MIIWTQLQKNTKSRQLRNALPSILYSLFLTREDDRPFSIALHTEQGKTPHGYSQEILLDFSLLLCNFEGGVYVNSIPWDIPGNFFL